MQRRLARAHAFGLQARQPRRAPGHRADERRGRLLGAFPLRPRECHVGGPGAWIDRHPAGTLEGDAPAWFRRDAPGKRMHGAQPRDVPRTRCGARRDVPARRGGTRRACAVVGMSRFAAQRAEHGARGRQLQPTRRRHRQPTPVGDHRAHAAAAHGLLDGPEPRTVVAGRHVDQDRPVMEPRIGPGAHARAAEEPRQRGAHPAHQFVPGRPRHAADPCDVPVVPGMRAVVVDQRPPGQLHEHRTHRGRLAPPLMQARARHAATERRIDRRPARGHARARRAARGGAHVVDPGAQSVGFRVGHGDLVCACLVFVRVCSGGGHGKCRRAIDPRRRGL